MYAFVALATRTYLNVIFTDSESRSISLYFSYPESYMELHKFKKITLTKSRAANEQDCMHIVPSVQEISIVSSIP